MELVKSKKGQADAYMRAKKKRLMSGKSKVDRNFYRR